MNRLLKWLGVSFVVVAAVALGAVGYLLYVGRELDDSSKQYVDEAVVAVTKEWSTEELLKRASPQLSKTINLSELAVLFKKLSRLGRLKRYEGSIGDANISLTVQHGKVVTAAYVANADFDRGRAQFTIRVLQSKGQWEILQFYVSSPVLLE